MIFFKKILYISIFLLSLSSQSYAQSNLLKYSDSKALALGGATITPVSRTSAIYVNPANLYAFKGLGFDLDLSLLFRDVNIDFYKIDFESENSKYKNHQLQWTGSLSVTYEINPFVYVGFAFNIPVYRTITLLIGEADQKNMDYERLVRDIRNSGLGELFLNSSKPVENEKQKRELINSIIIPGIPEIDFKYITYRFSPAFGFSFDFFKIGITLNLEMTDFKSIHKTLESQLVFSLGAQLGVLFEVPRFKLGLYVASPLYMDTYVGKRALLPSKVLQKALKAGEGDELYQVTSGTRLTSGIGISVDVLPNFIQLLLDYKVDLTESISLSNDEEEDEKENAPGVVGVKKRNSGSNGFGDSNKYFNKYLLHFGDDKKESKKDKKSSSSSKKEDDDEDAEYKKYKHNFAVGINIENDNFPLSGQLGYNFTLHYDETMKDPIHVISLGLVFKFLKIFYVKAALATGISNTGSIASKKDEDYYKKLIGIDMPKNTIATYEIMIGFGMNIF